MGYTPEGLDQNPAYYELLQEAAFKSAPEPNISNWLVKRAHRRYGLFGKHEDPHIAAAWIALGASGYAVDMGVSDGSGVGQMDVFDKLRLESTTGFQSDRCTPTRALCLEWSAWGSLNTAATVVAAAVGGPGRQLPEPFVYDLVNTAREVLAQLSSPALLNFSFSFSGAPTVFANEVTKSAAIYLDLLHDLDSLLATDTAFMLGPWLASARKLGGAADDCIAMHLAEPIGRCDDFMEWNARAQLTTWYPVLGSSAAPEVQQSGRDHDYARKQWSGLIKDVYIPRAKLYRDLGVRTAELRTKFNATEAAGSYARLAYTWQTGFPSSYPVLPVGDAVAISTALRNKWAPYFSACSEN